MTECNSPKKACEFASKAANEAVHQTFSIFGVDVDNPKEVEDFRCDIRFGGAMRKVADKGVMTFVVVLVGMSAAAFVAGVVVKIKQLIVQ